MFDFYVDEFQVLDDKNVRRRFRASNYQSTTRVKPFICTMPMRLDDGWNQVSNVVIVAVVAILVVVVVSKILVYIAVVAYILVVLNNTVIGCNIVAVNTRYCITSSICSVFISSFF